MRLFPPYDFALIAILRSTESSIVLPSNADHTCGRFPCSEIICEKSFFAFGTIRRIMEKSSEKEGNLFPDIVIIFSEVITCEKSENKKIVPNKTTAI